jgi:maltoporin
MDYYYLNNSGYGFGIHSIPVGNLGNFNLDIIKSNPGAFGGDDVGEKDFTINSYKLQAGWRGIPMWSDASLDIDLIYAWENMSDAQKEKKHGNNGFMALVEYTQGNFFGGFNKLSFTYGSDALDGVGVATWNHEGQWVVPYNQRGNGYRFLDWGVIEQPSWNLGYSFIVTHNDVKNIDGNKDGGSSWTPGTGNDYAFVLRPSYKWSDFTSTVLEYGYANLNNAPSDASVRFKYSTEHRVSLSKLTIAQQWTPGSQFWARPSIRVFATWMSGKGMDKQKTNLKDNHQFVIGSQVEAWW